MARFNIINLLEYNSTHWVEIDPVEVFLFSHKESFNNYMENKKEEKVNRKSMLGQVM